MKKLDKMYISIIVVLILYNIGITIALSIRTTDLINENTEYQIKADSLDKEIMKSQIIIDSHYKILDSITNNKQTIKNYYETSIQNLSTPSIVSDDSITSFIRKQIYSN